MSGGTELQRPFVLLYVTLCSGHESNQKYCAMVVDGVGSLAVSLLVQSICRGEEALFLFLLLLKVRAVGTLSRFETCCREETGRKNGCVKKKTKP